MELHANPLNEAVVWVFGNPMAAIWISAALLVWCALIIAHNWRAHHKPASAALKARLGALAPVRKAATTDEAQRELATRFYEVDEAMMSGGKEADELRQAWTQFRETILDETEVPLRATARPEGYFLHLSDDTRILAWWANIFVALGLTFTFLGIVAALTSTVTALNVTGSSGNMTPALVNLLQITSVKFWTSIAGVLASIILRWFDRRWHSATQRKLEAVCDRLERGTLFSPSQRIAALHLRETEQQTAALKTFSHELAVAIGENFERQMQPMVTVLGGIQASIDDFKSGSFNQIGKEFGEALSRQAGTEMQGLAAALTGMTENLRSVNERIEGSSQAASDQIAAAARDFLSASDAISQAFATLNERIEGMSSRIVEETEAATQRAASHVAEERAAYQAIADDQRTAIRAMSDEMRVSSAAAAEQNADILRRAADVLDQASTRAATGMSEAIDSAMAEASEKSAQAMEKAFESFGARFETASSGLVDTLRTTATRMESLAASIARSVEASDEHATRLTRAGEETQGIAATLTRAAIDLQGAAGPIRTASETIGNAVSRAGEALDRQADTAAAHQTAVTTISDRLSETTDTATRAWTGYRDRFEDVDRALAAALDQIKSASSEHAAHLNEQVGRIDYALASAVDRLSAALEPLTELTDQIEDLLGRMSKAA